VLRDREDCLEVFIRNNLVTQPNYTITMWQTKKNYNTKTSKLHIPMLKMKET